MTRITRATRWAWQWFIVGIVTTLATALLLIPAAIPAWLIYGWLAPVLDLPPLGFWYVAALIYLVRLSQASAVVNLPAESTPPDRGMRQ